MHQLWDKLFKIVCDRFPEDIVRFVLPGKDIRIYDKYEQEKISLEYQVADVNLWILDRGVKKLLNIEAYSEWRESIPVHVFTRNAMLTRSLDHECEVVSAVVVLDRDARPGEHIVTLGQEAVNRYSFPVCSGRI